MEIGLNLDELGNITGGVVGELHNDGPIDITYIPDQYFEFKQELADSGGRRNDYFSDQLDMWLHWADRSPTFTVKSESVWERPNNTYRDKEYDPKCKELDDFLSEFKRTVG